MPWFLLGLYWCLWLCVLTTVGLTGTFARILPAIHWNASNAMFKASNNDHIVEVNLYDEIDFICPHYPGETDPHMSEFYIIYLVSKREYDECYLNSSVKPLMLVNCNEPQLKHPKRFTIIFEPFSSIPDVPEYHKGGTYYFITTSTGTHGGLSNDHQGACLLKNMKLTIKVCCDSTTTIKPKSTTDGRTRMITPTVSTPTTQMTHPKPTPALKMTTLVRASTVRSTKPIVQPTPARTSHFPSQGTQKELYPTDKPPGGKDKEVPDGKDKNEVDPESPKYTGHANRNSLHHHSASWTLCLLATFIFLLTRR